MEEPLSLEDAGVEVIMPAFSALFAHSAGDKAGNEGPALGSILID